MILKGEILATRNASVIDDWNGGMTQREIAARHGIGLNQVHQIMRGNRSSITRVNATKTNRPLQPDYHALKLAFTAGTGHDSPHSAIQAGERTLAEWCEYVGSWRVA